MSLKGPLTDDVCELPLPEQNEAERAEAQSESLDTELIDNAACGHDRLRELATGTPPSATEEGAGQHTDGMDHDPHCAEGQDMETEESEGAGTVDQCTEELPKQEVLSWAPHNKEEERLGSRSAEKSHMQGTKQCIPPGWSYQGESDGYRYYIGSSGEMYSVDRDGYWYVQDGTGNFIPHTGYQYSRGPHSALFPQDSEGRFILPTNSRGEKAFPVDVNNMPIFPFDTATHLPTFPVDENGQPVFPTGGHGRPIVPVDTNGMAIFPRDANGRFIFPSGPNGKPTAPVNVYGIPVMPLDEQGKPVIPYDATGTPLIHLASDGITPLTEEEYQYSLQWNDYYSRYYKTAATQKTNGSRSAVVPSPAVETYEQKAKNMKLLKKVRPEDIDLPPSVVPSTQPPAPDATVSSGEVEKSKPASDPALKAKTKRMIEMQLKFSRKKLCDANLSTALIVDETKVSGETSGADKNASNLQPTDSSKNEKIEPLKEPPRTPVLAEVATDADGKKISDITFHGAQKTPPTNMDTSLEDLGSLERQKNVPYDVSKVQEQTTICRADWNPSTDVSTVMKCEDPSNKQTINLKSDGKLSTKVTAESFRRKDCRAIEKETTKFFEKQFLDPENGDVPKNLQEPDLANITIEEASVLGTQLKPNIEAVQMDGDIEKVITTSTASADRALESGVDDMNEAVRKHIGNDDRNTQKYGRHAQKSREYDEKQLRNRSVSRRRRSSSRSSYRGARRGSSRDLKRRSRSRSRTPQLDYHYYGKYRSRSRDRFYRHKSSYYDRRSYRRYWTPDNEDRHSYRRRRSSSREKRPRLERSASRGRTPSIDKSSRSRSYGERSKSRSCSRSPVASRHSSAVLSTSRYKTIGSRTGRSSSRRNSSEHDISRRTDCDSGKSPQQPNESLDDVIDSHRSVSRTATPRSGKSSVKEEPGVKSEKSKRHKKTKEKHKKKKKSHHKKKDKQKRSTSMIDNGLGDKQKASSALTDEAPHLLNSSYASSDEPTNRTTEETFSTKEEEKGSKKEKVRKRKGRKRKREQRSVLINEEGTEVTVQMSEETLEEGEIVTEKDMTPRVAEKILVSYEASDSEGERNDAEKSISEVQLEQSPINISSLTANSIGGDREFEEVLLETTKSSGHVSLQTQVITKENVPNVGGSCSEEGMEHCCDQMAAKQDTKITMELEDDRVPRKMKDLSGGSTELTAREAEKLKKDNITEAVNKLKKLRGYKNTEKTVAILVKKVPVMEQGSEASGISSLVNECNVADVPLPKEVQVTAAVAEKAEQTMAPEIRTQEASTSVKIDLMDKEAKRKKEIMKRKWEEDEEDELSRLRYEALRSKTRRLMNDLRAERRRLKRERIRATIAMRRARDRSEDTGVDEILLADTSDSSETDDSDDYSLSHKRKLLKRKRFAAENMDIRSSRHRPYGLEQRDYDGSGKQQQLFEKSAGGTEEQLETNAPNNLISELQERIGGTNEGALALLEQLRKCLAGGVVSSNIHVNPEVIRKNV